jgi:hypothetical protein
MRVAGRSEFDRYQLTLDVCVNGRNFDHSDIPAVPAPPPLPAVLNAGGEEPPGQTLTRDTAGQPAAPGGDDEQAHDESAADEAAAALPGQIAAASAAIRAHVSHAWRNRLSALRGPALEQPPETGAEPGEPGGQADGG